MIAKSTKERLSKTGISTTTATTVLIARTANVYTRDSSAPVVFFFCLCFVLSVFFSVLCPTARGTSTPTIETLKQSPFPPPPPPQKKKNDATVLFIYMFILPACLLSSCFSTACGLITAATTKTNENTAKYLILSIP